MLHALLIPGTVSFLSVASNRRMKTAAFRLIGAYVKKAKSLQFLDLSQNALDKKSMEYVVGALETAPEPGLVSLRLDDCQLRPAALETLCVSIRRSPLYSTNDTQVELFGLHLCVTSLFDITASLPVVVSPSPS